MHRYLTLLFFFFVAILSVNAQNTCEYQLILNDLGGEGFEDAEVFFFIENDSTIFESTGATDTFNISLVDGDSISVEFLSQVADNSENNIQILDSDGRVLLNTTDPDNEVLLEAFAFCPSCPAIVLNSVVNVDSFDNRILIDWEPSDSLGTYSVVFAPCGFLNNPDSVQVIMSAISEATIPGLTENTCYEYQIFITCLSGEESISSGPDRGQTIFTNDVGVSGVFAPSFPGSCEFNQSDTLIVFLKNFGAAPQSLVPFDFTIARGELEMPMSTVVMPDDGLFTGILVKDSCVAFPFETPINIEFPGEYTITSFTSLETDGQISNDTFVFTFSHSSFLPFLERFTDNQLPFRWTSDSSTPITNGVVTDTLGPLNSRFLLDTERYGFISDMDTLTFSYLFSDLSGAPATLTAGDRLLIEASRDCGATFEMIDIIDMSNFDTSVAGLREFRVSLSDFVDDIISFRFSALRGGSSFVIQLDDINVNQCIGIDPLRLDTLIVNPTESLDDGSITVRPEAGLPPFTFEFSNGVVVPGLQGSISGLAPGLFSVTVTDSAGCFDTRDFVLDVFVSTFELSDITQLNIYPNPVSDLLNVEISLETALDLDVKIYNVMGQEMWSSSIQADRTHNMPISTQDFNQGIYFLQLSSDAGQVTEKFVVER